MKLTFYTRLIGLSVALLPITSVAQNAALDARIAKLAQAEEAKVIAWRRDFHQHPELGNAETRTAGIVAAHLKSLGLEVQTGVGHTGVVGLLHGGRPGPVVALRADMDALPITENPGLAFAFDSKNHLPGPERGRDARLRPRLAHGHAHGRGRGVESGKVRPTRHRQVYFPTRRGR